MEEKRKRGRPKKSTQLPEEILKIVLEVQLKEEEEIHQIVVLAKLARKGKWDVPKDAHIEYFDKRLSYELTGYRPITDTLGLDFNPDWFTVARDTYLKTGHYTQYRFGTKAYDDFFKEEYIKCRDGYTVNDYTVTGPMYYYLNYYLLPNIDVEKAGSGRSAIFPRFLIFLYEFFHYFEICRILKKDVCLMKARGIGFSEINASICANIYNCFSESKCMITAHAKNYLDKSLDKVWGALDFANDHTDGGFAKLRQGKDTQYLKRASSKEKDANGLEYETGWLSEIEGIVADTDAKIRGDRVDMLIYEEAGSNPVLRKSYIKGKALIYIGGSKFGIRVVGGTGGDSGAALEDLRHIYEDPASYDVLPFKHNYTPTGEWILSGYFIPSYIGAVTTYGTDGQGIKRLLLDDRGYCLWQNYKELLDADRANIKDPKALLDHCAEYCYTAEEAFALEGNNKFNLINIAEQLTKIRALKECPPIDTGRFRFIYKKGSPHKVEFQNIEEVQWQNDPRGHIKILEHPIWLLPETRDEETGEIILRPKYPMANLYVAGVDGIDIGQSQTSSYTKDPSSFCIVIYKRVFGLLDPQVVAIYKDRPDDLEEAYDCAISLAMYYNAKINIEATRLSFVTWAKKCSFLRYFMHRPKATYPDITKAKSTAYGTPATGIIIAHQTDLIQTFVENYCYTLWFEEILDELNRYSDEAKRKFDIVAALGMAMLADEELSGSIPISTKSDEELENWDIGYYIDENGHKRWGVIYKNKQQETKFSNDFAGDYSHKHTSDPRYR